MATLEHEQLIRGPRSRPREQHVFVSADGHRQRVLRLAGLVAGALALVWLVALALALAGSARLPGLPGPGAKQVAVAPDASAATARRTHSHSGGRTARPAASTLQRAEPQSAPAPATPARAAAPAPPPTLTRPTTVVSLTPAPPPAQTQTGAAPRQGWTRHGWTTSPGQTRRNPAPRGAGHPADTTGTTATGAAHADPHGKKG